MAMTLPAKPSVIVDADGVLIQELRERDPELVAVASEAEDPEQAVRSCLTVGARALRGVQVTVDAAVVETKFNEFEHNLDEIAKQAVDQIGQVSQEFLDPKGGALRKMIDEFAKNLGDTFDPKSKASALSKLEKVFAAATADQAKVVRNLVDPGNPKSPLGRLRGEMAKDLKEVREALTKVQTQLAVNQTEAEVLELTAVKGLRFEEAVFESAGAFVSMYGDQVESVGTEPGSEGGRVGDLVVTLSEDDAPSGRAAYVVEVKDRKMTLREVHAELDRAMKNRDAKAGVLVFSRQKNAPVRTPFKPFGNKAIVVLDKEEPDEHPLRLGLMWARCAVQRQLSAPDEQLDVAGALALIEKGQRALASKAAIRGYHTRAKKQIDGAGEQIAKLVDEVEEILREVAHKLGR